MSSEYYFITSNNEKIPIIIINKRGVKNIILRPRNIPLRQVRITKPWLVSDKKALTFVEQKRNWLDQYFLRIPRKAKLCSGDFIYVLDKKIQVVYDYGRRGNEFVDNEDGTFILVVGGDSLMLENRVREFIKRELLNAIKVLIKEKTKEFWPDKIVLRDTSSRWGSCSSSGTISFSWRLAFAPYDVMRYVVMHEIAHRKYMNHSSDFWNLVDVLYGPGVVKAKNWLKLNGAKLHQYL